MGATMQNTGGSGQSVTYNTSAGWIVTDVRSNMETVQAHGATQAVLELREALAQVGEMVRTLVATEDKILAICTEHAEAIGDVYETLTEQYESA